MVRAATVDDIPAIVALGAALCAESPRWGRLNFNGERLGGFLASLIESEDGFVYVGERHGQVVGAMLGIVDQHWCCDDLVAQELSLFVDPSARGSMIAVRLITHLVAWANVRGAKVLQVGTSTGICDDRVVALYERLGFDRAAVGLEVEYGD